MRGPHTTPTQMGCYPKIFKGDITVMKEVYWSLSYKAVFAVITQEQLLHRVTSQPEETK